MVYLNQLIRDFKVGWIHNPSEFNSSSFWTEVENAGSDSERIVLYGRTKRNKRNPGSIRKVAILKKKKTRETYKNIFGENIWK